MKTLPVSQKNQAFTGYRQTKDSHGFQQYQFNFPFDDNKYDCYLEIYNVKKDNRGYYSVTNKVDNISTSDGQFKLENGKNNCVDLSYDYLMDENTPFAYHYKLVNKHNPYDYFYRIDAGDVIDNRKDANDKDENLFNQVTANGSKINRGGAMKLIIPDNYNPNYYYNDKNEITLDKKSRKSGIHKNFANKIGGSLAGVENALKNGDFNSYSSIISLPIFTDDDLTEHGYWNKNCMQMISSLGNINNYASLQKTLFAKGINWVSDGAFVNEGLEGVHFANLLKWGEQSPYYYWFKASGLQNGPFKLGVFGKNIENVSHKVVNSPYIYTQSDDGTIKISRNKDYAHNKPTYVQIFDKTMTSEENQKDLKNIFKYYDKLDNTNPYAINTHDDTVINYHFEIDPETYHKNVKNLITYNKNHEPKIQLYSGEGTAFVNKYENFSLEHKIESNFRTWDANTDIAQLNYTFSPADIENDKNLNGQEKFKKLMLSARGNNEAKDYVITSGIYWTQKTKDILTLHAAQQFRNIEGTQDAIQRIKDKAGVTIPESILDNINKETVNNIINGDYKLPSKLSDETYNNQILAGIMNFPLDSIEFGDNIAGVLASPYITKRASTPEEVGISRFEIYKNGNPNLPEEYKRAYLEMQNIYKNEMSDFANQILTSIQKEISPLKDNENATTLYGKYVLPLMTQEIAKFAVIKALYPQAKVFANQNGEISYDYKALKNTSLQDLGIFGASPEDEALLLTDKIKKGIKLISDKDKQFLENALINSYKGTNEKSFALADAVIDLTQSGLDWRIDAAKDIADIDALRNGQSDFKYTWQEITDFWKEFNKNILKVNPYSYLVAEMTDEMDLYNIGGGRNLGMSDSDLIKLFLNNTGMTATANYSSFFTDNIMLFGKRNEFNAGNMDKEINHYNVQYLLHNKLLNEDYLRSSNLNSLLYSYTFIGNHDKPRILHTFALDMQQFFADLTLYDNANGSKIQKIQEDNNAYPKYLIDEYRKRAFRVLNNRYLGNVDDKEVENYDFSKVSSKAVAMGELMMHGFSTAMNDMAQNNKHFADKKQKVFEAVAEAISTLSNGEYLGKNFNADAFGVKPFNVNIDAIIEQAKISKGEFPLNDKEIKDLKEKTFHILITPALTRLLGAMKVLTVLPGKPTMYHGDDIGETGFEEKTKNIYKANRNYIHNEWIQNDTTINEFYNHFKNVMALRKRPELDALNNGTPYILKPQNVVNNNNFAVTGLLRQNPDGKMAVTLLNLNGVQHDNKLNYSEPEVTLDYIDLNYDYANGNVRMQEKIGFRSGLKENMIFIDANNENDKYIVKHDDTRGYYLKRTDNKQISFKDTILVLYYDPEKGKKKLSFTGNSGYKIPAKAVIKAYRDTNLS